jgi:polyisoprenoid-binding protein YceI
MTSRVTLRASLGLRWVVDPVHSQIDFRLRHLVGRVQGTFIDWYGLIVTKDRDWTHGTMNVSAQTASLNTGNAYRGGDHDCDRGGAHYVTPPAGGWPFGRGRWT